MIISQEIDNSQCYYVHKLQIITKSRNGGIVMNQKPKILVVGSFVMDQIATTEIVPREGQTVLGKTFHKAPGGKGANQAVQAARLGAEVTMVGKLGHDANGEEMIKVCKEAGIDVSHVLYDDEASSGCAMIILQEKPGEATQNRILVIPGTNMRITEEDVAFLKNKISAYDMVILQNEIPMQINLIVAKYAHDAGVPVMLNSAPSAPIPEELYGYLTYISPNETEIEDMTGIHIEHEGKEVNLNTVRQAAEALRSKGVENVLVTLGSAGAFLVTDAEEVHSPCATGIKAVDPTAAGDSFVGAFCVGTCLGWSRGKTLVFANHTAGITVSRMGAMPSLPTLDMVKEDLKKRGIEHE